MEPLAKYSALDQRAESPKDSLMPLASSNATRIAAEISRLLAHYWAANEDHRLRAALAADWLADLGEFSSEVVADACTDWRRGQSKRPTISDIRGRCITIQAEHRPVRSAPQTTQEQRVAAARAAAEQVGSTARAVAWRQRFAEERGFASFAEVMTYGIVRAAKLPVRGDAIANAPEIAMPQPYEMARLSEERAAELLALMDRKDFG
jgi:hypothetical protein